MPFSVNITDPLGGLDADTDLAKVRNGDYTGALNVSHISQAGQTSWAIENTLGNKYRFNIEATVAQNKKYRVLINTVAATARQVTFYKTDGSIWFVVNYADNAVFATAYNNFLTAVNAAFAAAVPVQSGTVTNANPYATVEITTGGVHYEYSIASTGVNSTTVEIIQEAITNSLAGDANVIGSFDLLGDLFIWSTPTNEIPSVLPVTITNATNPASPGPIVITTSGAHGLSAGDEVLISGVTGQLAANGIWIAIPGSSVSFSLWNSIGTGAYTGGGTVTINNSGVGEIGVAVNDPNTDTTTYTRLIRSKEFNFRTAKQIDTYCEANNFQRSLYWTDDYNIPRVLYYRGAYSTDGAINYFDVDGLYSYGTISDETKLILTNEQIGFLFTKQLQAGGGILSGNWRYSVRLLTSTFSGTNWTELSNPINVFRADTGGTGSAICGDDAGVVTGKINQFTLSNLPVGVFAYIELAGVNYVETAIVGSIIKRVAIDSATMEINHTGLEANVTNLDVPTLNQFSFDIETAKNIDAIDNRLILSNLTTSQEIDFSDFALTLTHSLFKKTITGINIFPAGNRFGEFQDPINVYNYVGYMMNDTYRMGVKFQLKSTGNFTKVFYVDDITIDTSATNVTTPNRRISGLADYNLTQTGTDPLVYVPYIQFSNINLDYLIDGVKLRDIVSSIHFERVERVKEILTTGMLAMTVTGTDTGTQEEYGAGVGYGENPYISGFGGVADTYPSAGFVVDRTIGKLYSPDILCGNTALSFLSGDTMLSIGNPENVRHTGYPVGGALFDSDISEYNGFFTTASLGVGVLVSGQQLSDGQSGYVLPISGFTYYQELTRGAITQSWDIKGGFVVEISNTFATGGANPDYGFYYGQYFRAIAYSDPSDPTTSKYGNPSENVFIPTGAILTIDGSTSGTPSFAITSASNAAPVVITTTVANSFVTGDVVNISGVVGSTTANGQWTIIVLSPTTFSLTGSLAGGVGAGGLATLVVVGENAFDIFGGDVFTQKTYLKHRCGDHIAGDNGGGGVGFYSQNVVNSQMIRKYNNANVEWTFPNGITGGTWLFTSSFGSAIAPYNEGYTIVNGVSAEVGFDSTLPDQSDLPTQIRYSDLKPQNSIIDNFRTFLPLNFKDLPMTWGEITHHANFNGELFTWQPRMLQRQYFNTRGTMSVGGGANTDVLIGDGTVFSRDGQMITNIGTFHKWSVLKGRSAQGNDTMYWINTELKKAMRMGYDGTVSVGDVHGMRSFLANNLTWVSDKDTPADGEGICGTWDDRYACAIWTIRGQRVIEQWIATPPRAGTGYEAGAVVYNVPVSFSTFEQTGEFYVSLVNNNAFVTTNTAKWQLIPHTGSVTVIDINTGLPVTYYAVDYYNEYTIEFNEQKNKFTTFYTFKPKIYLKWTDTFLTPRPISDTGNIYEHRLGRYCIWYDQNGVFQSENGYLELLFNKDENLIKEFFAILINSQIVPVRIDYYTKKQQTFVVAADFETDIDFWTASIKNDILTSSNGLINDEDTSRLFGQWIKVKISYEVDVYQKVVDIVTKFLAVSRTYNK